MSSQICKGSEVIENLESKKRELEWKVKVVFIFPVTNLFIFYIYLHLPYFKKEVYTIFFRNVNITMFWVWNIILPFKLLKTKNNRQSNCQEKQELERKPEKSESKDKMIEIRLKKSQKLQ